MPIDPSTLQRLCGVIWSDDGKAASSAAHRELEVLVGFDPAGCFEAVRVAAAAAKAQTGDASEFSSVINALRAVDDAWLHRAIDLIPSEPAMWDAIGSGNDRAVLDRLGVATVSRAWHEEMRTSDTRSWWATKLLSIWDLDDRIDEPAQRKVLLRLIEDADDESIWVTAAGPLEDFITDDEDRLIWIEQQAACNPKFRFALTGVWLDSKSEATTQRIERARWFEQN